MVAETLSGERYGMAFMIVRLKYNDYGKDIPVEPKFR
jgi:hypothetical protein